METSFEGRDAFDLSLEDEYLSPGMLDISPDCVGLSDFVPSNFMPQTHQSIGNTVNNEWNTVSDGMDDLDSANYGGMINPDDFLNDILCDSSNSLSNRNTPSPSDSQESYDSAPSAGGFDGCHVVPMHLDSPPISPQSPVSPKDETNALKSNSGPRRLKIVPNNLCTSSGATKTITKKTIVLSAKDYRALLANLQRQTPSNTIILKATPTNTLPIESVVKPLPTSTRLLKQEMPLVLPKPTVKSREVETTYEIKSPAAIKKEPTRKTFSPLTIPMMLAAGTTLSEHTIDEKILKKHQRMIKNRQSAYESRQKKKEYVTSLEERLEQLSIDNQQLRVENASLLEKLKMRCTCSENNLLVGNLTVKQVIPTARKNTAIVLAMLFMVSLNFYPIGNLLTNTDHMELDQMSDKVVEYHSRGLLWMNESSNLSNRQSRPFRVNLTVIDELIKEDSIEMLSVTKCPLYVNQTENIRLASELRRWIGENGYKNLTDGKGQPDVTIDTFDKMFRLKDTIDSIYQHMKDISMHMKTYERRQQQPQSGKKLARNRPRKATGQREMVSYHRKIPNHHDLDLYYPRVHVKYAEFFEEIGRRDDTFYLVSFSEEHLLLPALAYNKTNRPRMSLMLPTITASGTPMGNGTNRSDKITLMQIDCEVMNTSVIQIREKTIPGALRPQGSETAKGGSVDPYGNRNATNPEVNKKRSGGRPSRGTSGGTRLVRSNSSTTAHATSDVEEIQQKRKSVQLQHVPIRPFFVERINDHLKSVHHVN
uniref:BZIP domain-containing protein n=1 Tax=Anopheles funestus TaxID=62324 RepID=A0A182RUT1_ANOFN